MTATTQPPPRPLSTATVAGMIHLYEYMFERRGALQDPLFDIRKLSTTLFAMGFDHEFLVKCETRYYWHFASLFPALYDGTFYESKFYGQSRGQGDLRGFATFLCGVFADHPQHRTEMNDNFEQSLLTDGYRYVGRTLVESSTDTSSPPELAALPNREDLLKDLSMELKGDETVGVLFVDLDAFKSVNDRLGHAEGTRCLSTIVQTLSHVLRRKGKLYRVGGDEFCVMLPNFSVAEAAATAERVRACVDALKPFGGLAKVTTSIGVAVSDRKRLSTPDTLVDAADEAMYVSKFTTKNRICLWPPNPEEAAEATRNRQKAARATSP